MYSSIGEGGWSGGKVFENSEIHVGSAVSEEKSAQKHACRWE